MLKKKILPCLPAVKDMGGTGSSRKLLTHYYVGTVGQCWKEQVVKECFYFPWSVCACFIIQLNKTLPWEQHI